MQHYLEGACEPVLDPTPRQLAKALAGLDPRDIEHDSIWLVDAQSGWTLEFNTAGVLSWENLETKQAPRHLVEVSRDRALELWGLLLKRQIEAIELLQWKPGHLPPISDVDRSRQRVEVEAHMLQLARNFYDELGPERAGTECRRKGCERGTIELSVLCRPHHYESIKRSACPFDD